MTRFILRCTLAGLLLGSCVLNIMVSMDRAKASRDALYELRMNHFEFRLWLSENTRECSPLIFQRGTESAQKAMALLPDEGGCLIFRPGIQPAMSDESALIFPSRFVNTTMAYGYFKQYGNWPNKAGD